MFQKNQKLSLEGQITAALVAVSEVWTVRFSHNLISISFLCNRNRNLVIKYTYNREILLINT